jgi:hypothetical protein
VKKNQWLLFCNLRKYQRKVKSNKKRLQIEIKRQPKNPALSKIFDPHPPSTGSYFAA